MKKRKMIKHGWIIVVIVLLVVLVIFGALYLLHRENLKAVANAKQYTQEELQEQLADSRQTVEESLAEQYPEVQVRDLTEEERTALREGTMTREELIAALIGSPTGSDSVGDSPDDPGSAEGSTAEHESTTEPSPETPESSAPEVTATPTPKPSSTPAPEATSAPTSTPAPATASPGETSSAAGSAPELTEKEEYANALAELVAEVYVMREEFTAQLDEMYAAAKAEYMAMPESERSRKKLISWASGYITKASALEKQCDAKMDDILIRVQQLAEQYGQDTSIVNTLASSYALEKSIQKSLYIQELEKRGIL